MRCNCCGQFRKEEDLRELESDSVYGQSETWLECRFCMSQSDLEHYGFEQTNEKQTPPTEAE